MMTLNKWVIVCRRISYSFEICEKVTDNAVLGCLTLWIKDAVQYLSFTYLRNGCVHLQSRSFLEQIMCSVNCVDVCLCCSSVQCLHLRVSRTWLWTCGMSTCSSRTSSLSSSLHLSSSLMPSTSCSVRAYSLKLSLTTEQHYVEIKVDTLSYC